MAEPPIALPTWHIYLCVWEDKVESIRFVTVT